MESEEQKRVSEKRNFLNAYPNADICIVNLALAIYGENSKKLACDKISLEKSIDLASELYKKKF